MMACKASYELYHNFPKLAEEAGFAFNTHRPRVHIEWNKIRLLDIESLIRERKFVLVEQHLNDILDCVLESEFDVRILDEGVIKIFRLAQLAVEYQQFCRHYLDRSVYVLREEISSLAQELEANKRNLREKEEDIKRLRKKSKHNIRTPLPYGNENIATIILNTLKNQSDIFPSTTHLDALQHHKCDICDKVFLNQLYLKSHMARRHPNSIETPQKDLTNKNNSNNESKPITNENSDLKTEIADLKTKLKEMEGLIKKDKQDETPASNNINNDSNIERKEPPIKEMKDAEVLVQDQDNLLDKIQEWKQQEFDNYKKELDLLRTQIMHVVNGSKEVQNIGNERDVKMIEELKTIIKQQGDELLKLKQQLIDSQSLKENMEAERRKEIENQVTNWAKKVEIQSNECKSLLQKLNEMAKDVQEYKALAKAEREKANKLQELLNEKIKETNNKNKSVIVNKSVSNSSNGTGNRVDHVTLERLQKKAQELLSMEQSTISDLSTDSEESNRVTKFKNKTINSNGQNEEVIAVNRYNVKNNDNYRVSPKMGEKQTKPRSVMKTVTVNKKKKKKSSPQLFKKSENKQPSLPVSPAKVVRAKITEEVNQRLVQLGVDPLKKQLPKTTFQKQRNTLQKLQEIKTKKYPSREKIYHCIQANLDANTIGAARNNGGDKESGYVSPNKTNKTFSLSSVLSNVKTKALSLVKPTEKLSINNSYNHVSRKVEMESSPKKTQLIQSPNSHERKENVKVRQSTKDTLKKYTSNVRNPSSHESESDDDNEKDKSSEQSSNDIDKIVKSPIRKPTQPYKIEINGKDRDNHVITKNHQTNIDTQNESSDDIESLQDTTPRKAFSEENISPKQTKSVLKNASSTSSLNKKKVLFDMDAIQMKSLSATPSLSLAEKSDNNEKDNLGVINLDTDEWDPSSIEHELPKHSIQVSTRSSPKIAELKQAIESQMSRRIQTPSTVLAGSVDILPIPMVRTSIGGSNTSLGSSILDESEHIEIAPRNKEYVKTKSEKQNFLKTKKVTENDDSEIDFSELLADDKSDNKF